MCKSVPETSLLVKPTSTPRYFTSQKFKQNYVNTTRSAELFSLICINENNLVKNLFRVTDFLTQLGYTCRPTWDFIGISETFLKDGDPSLHICNYKLLEITEKGNQVVEFQFMYVMELISK